MFISTYLPGLRAAGFPKEARFVHLIFAPVGASKCNFPAFLGNYNRPTSQTTDRPTSQYTDMGVYTLTTSSYDTWRRRGSRDPTAAGGTDTNKTVPGKAVRDGKGR